MAASGILIAGTSSDAGKSVIVAGLCRAFARRGVRVAPFKAQNMSNNSMVCADGGEIGRAQYLQAQAARVVPTTAMNPVLLKPGTDRRSFIVVRGHPAGMLEAGQYAAGRGQLADAAFAAYRELAREYDLVVCEGAGSPAEINLRAGDYVNLGLAHEFGLPVAVVGDIDRGGILASLYGTWAVLDDADRALLKAFIINKFRGDVSVLQPGLEEITRRTGVPFLGVIPWLLDVWLDSEDTLQVGHWRASSPLSASARDRLRVAVVRLPRISNATDVDALAAEPGVDVLVTIDPAVCDAADLLILPGSRSTTSDLEWLRERGLAEVVARRAAVGRPVLGICGGYEMLAHRIEDDVEGRADVVPGLGLLPTQVRFGAEKVLGRPSGSWEGHQVDTAYEIHHGLASPIESAKPAFESAASAAKPFLDGWVSGPVWGTMWHGAFESDDFRRAWLSEIALTTGSQWRPHPGAPGFAERRETMLETLADALEEHVDLDALLDLAHTTRRATTAAKVRPAGSLVWPSVTALAGDVVSLRPLTPDDWPTLLAEDTNSEARRWSLDPEPLDELSARARAVSGAFDWNTGRAARFVIIESASGAPAGVISVVRVGPPGVGMIGYGVLPEFRGRGFTTLALRLLTEWVFGETEIVRLELGHKDGNEASGRAAVKAGFVREGRMAGRLRNPDGTYSDEIGYGLVRPELATPPIPRPGPR